MAEPRWQYEARPLHDDERALLNHVMRWGSDGYPVARVASRHWSWSFRTLSAPRCYPTKREATTSFETYLDVVRELHARESYARAIARD